MHFYRRIKSINFIQTLAAIGVNYRPLYIISLVIALTPMILGSIIFWAWFIELNNNMLEKAGVLVILISTPICLINMILAYFVERKNKGSIALRKKTNRVIYLTLGNIPIAIFYVWFASYLMDTEIITLVNNSDHDIENILIFGTGEEDEIELLEKGESETVWVHMSHEGSIKMRFSKNGQTDTTYITGYSGPGMGAHRSTHIIN